VANQLNLKDIERKVYLSYHQDGLLELFIGLWFLIFCFGIAHDAISYLGGTVPPIGVALFVIVKKVITVPRIGLVNFSQTRKIRIKKEKVFFAIFFAVTVTISAIVYFIVSGISSNVQELIIKFIMAPMGLLIAISLCFVAFWKQLLRFYFFCFVILASVFIGPLFEIAPPTYFAIPGVVLILSGSIMLSIFLNKFPKPAKEN
jgi:hypothetical protein